MLNDSTAINGEKKTHAYIKEFLCSLEFQKPTDSKHYLIVYGEAWWQTSSKRIYFPFSLNNTKTKGPKFFQLCRFKQYNFKRSFFGMFVTFVQEMTTFDVHVFYKIIMRKMYHSSRLLRHPTRFRKLGYVLLDDVT